MADGKPLRLHTCSSRACRFGQLERTCCAFDGSLMCGGGGVSPTMARRMAAAPCMLLRKRGRAWDRHGCSPITMLSKRMDGDERLLSAPVPARGSYPCREAVATGIIELSEALFATIGEPSVALESVGGRGVCRLLAVWWEAMCGAEEERCSGVVTVGGFAVACVWW